jgi:hypothetical protein
MRIRIAQLLGLGVRKCNSIDDLESKKDGNFSCILAVDVIERLEKPDVLHLLATSVRTLVYSSYAVQMALVGRRLFSDISHVWTYTSVARSSLLAMTGYRSAEFHDESIRLPPVNGISKFPQC